MNDWRSGMIQKTKALLYCLNLNSIEKVQCFFEDEFRELIKPIQTDYPDVCKITKSNDSLVLSIGKNRLELKTENNETINVCISRISSSKGAPDLWGILHVTDVPYIEMLLPKIREGTNIFLDKSLVDELFKTAFEQPWFF